MKKQTIKCSHCDGTGRIEFTGVYADTLAFLRKQSQPLSGASLARLFGVKDTAMANRLVWLEQHGMATSERYGAIRKWRAR